MLRLFVAIPLPIEIQDELAGIGYGIPAANWVPDENLHLNLRFIGDVPTDVAQDIDASLHGVRVPAFDLTIQGVGYFGKLREARAIWAGVARCEPLQRLRDKVESACVRAGLPPEGRKFVPHITLARLKGETGHHLAQFLTEHSLLRLPPFTVEHFTLFRSHIKSSGSIYEPLAEYPMEGAMMAMAAGW